VMQIKQLSAKAIGGNSQTGVKTHEFLGCK
jgi:hypothetical protein